MTRCSVATIIPSLQPCSFSKGFYSNRNTVVQVCLLSIVWVIKSRIWKKRCNLDKMESASVVSGNVLVLRSKVCGFKPGCGRCISSGRKNPGHKSSGRDCKLGVPSLRFQAR